MRKRKGPERRAHVKSRRGPISLGDVIDVVVQLRPGDEETIDNIRALLGIGSEPTTMALPNVGAWKPSTTDAIAPTPVQPVVSPSVPVESKATSSSDAETAAIEARLVTTGTGPPPPPDWAVTPGGAIGSASRTAPPSPPPLFGPPRGRAILSTTLATVVDEGDVDLERVVERLAAGEVITTLPRLPSLTLRRGVQLLIDRGPGLDPFRSDADLLVRHLDDILGDDRLDVLSFAGCPSRGMGSGPRLTWRPWTSHRPGTPVVVVTDLGIGGPLMDPDRATVSEWLRFARRVREAACELIALVPYEAGRWPPVLARAMSVIHWSERTSVGSVRRARREAHVRLR